MATDQYCRGVTCTLEDIGSHLWSEGLLMQVHMNCHAMHEGKEHSVGGPAKQGGWKLLQAAALMHYGPQRVHEHLQVKEAWKGEAR